MAGRDLILPDFTNRNVANADRITSEFGGSRETTEVRKEGAKHLVAQQLQGAKTVAAVSLTTEVYRHALSSADQLKNDAYKRLEQGHRSTQHQADYEQVHGQLMTRYDQHVVGIVEVGVTAIAREVHRDVIVPKEPKKGWFK